ncbi:EamA family transporter RarD [Nocardioidaceae bacterium]|nr:EamA family transporter RarD [Nocardioidaceae bacterium]
MSETRKGLLLGFSAYAMWGLFPLYFPLMEPAGAVEVLAHRIVWSLVTMTVVVLVLRRRRQLVALLREPRALLWLGTAAVVIGVNWGVYIWATTNEHVVEASLGYFINPLVSVLLGVVFFAERLRGLQWAALALATAAVVVLTVEIGEPPWVSLALAFSFGTYGLAKKRANRGAVEGLTVETMLLAPIALAYLLVLNRTGEGTFTSEGTVHVLLLLTLGVVTAVPLLCFGGAATRVPLTVIGFLQYVTPILQFLIGVVVFSEEMTRGRWIGFALVWLALVLFSAESLRHHRRQRRAVRRSAVAPVAA